MLNAITLNNLKAKFNFQINKNVNQNPFVNLNGSNLAPLKYDTVSFGNNKTEKAAAIKESFQESLAQLSVALLPAVSLDACKEASENSKMACNNLEKTLKTFLGEYVSTKANPDNIIYKIETRIKSPNSIREKSAEKLARDIISKNSQAFNIRTAEGIKSRIEDIPGARVILQDALEHQANQVIDALIQAVESGKLKITKIENYKTDKTPEELEYFSMSKLKELETAVNKINPDNPIKIKQKTKSSGYMALHLDVDLTNAAMPVKNAGYIGEIQIIGKDVAELKNVEDFCYKLKSHKVIKGKNPCYEAFSQYFLKYYDDREKYPNLKADFNEYTEKAYKIQRMKNPQK